MMALDTLYLAAPLICRWNIVQEDAGKSGGKYCYVYFGGSSARRYVTEDSTLAITILETIREAMESARKG